MDLTILQSIITACGGEDKVIGLIFDNSARQIFTPERPFILANCLVAGTDILKFQCSDTSGVAYTVYKPIETIQTVVTVADAEAKKKIDLRYAVG